MLRKLELVARGLELTISLTFLAVIVVAVFLQVLFRYVFEAPLSWTEELARTSLIWLTFVGAAVAVRRQAHFALALVVGRLPARFRPLWEAFLASLIVIFLVVLLYQGIQMLPLVHSQLSPSLELPMSYAYLAIPAGAALMLVHLGVALAEHLGVIQPVAPEKGGDH
ncbi:MAG: TRAP transporter small permease [Candidatus Methylomirabilales bacterium]